MKYEPVDYAVMGHITCDLADNESRIGGTVTYSALTAKQFGYQAGIVTAYGEDISTSPLDSIQIASQKTSFSTSFKNIPRLNGHSRWIQHIAPAVLTETIPEYWKDSTFFHIAPVAQEVQPSVISSLRSRFKCLTLQGWLREWDETGQVRSKRWMNYQTVLPQLDAVVLSIHDVDFDWAYIQNLADCCRLLVVTRGVDGSVLYDHGARFYFPARSVTPLDTTGAGDIFASVFFITLFRYNNPMIAVRAATLLAEVSVTRSGLDSIPTISEISQVLQELIQ